VTKFPRAATEALVASALRMMSSLPSAHVWVAPTRSNELPVHGMPPSQTPGLHAQECIRVYLGPVEGPANLRLLSSARHEMYESIL
jgi:hypothetical protein